MSQKLIFVSKNGSSGKSTSVQGVAGTLGIYGVRVRLHDLDDQQDLTQWAGRDDPDDLAKAPTIYDVFAETATIDQAERPIEGLETVTIVPSPGAKLEEMGVKLMTAYGSEVIYGRALAQASPVHVDILDLHGGSSVFTRSALETANGVVTVSNPRGKEAKGIIKVMAEVEFARSRRNPNIRPVGVVPCEVDTRAEIYTETHEEIIETYGDLVTPPVRRRSSVDEAYKLRTMTALYPRASDVTNDYVAVTAHIAMLGAFDKAIVVYLAESGLFEAKPVVAAAQAAASEGRPALERFITHLNRHGDVPDTWPLTPPNPAVPAPAEPAIHDE